MESLERALQKIAESIEKNSYIQSFDWVTIASCALSILALVFSVLSWKYSKKRRRIETSIKFTEVYKSLISDISFITSVLNNHKDIIDLVNKVDFNKVKLFNYEELKTFYSESELEIFHEFFYGDLPNAKVILNFYLLHNATIFENPPKIPEGELGDDLLKMLFQRKVSNSLNSLEYFSMAFVQNVASEEVVYQSLHQSFFHVVKSLYYLICSWNKNESDKYYTNLIELFNIWSEKEKNYLNKV